jgi:2-octaprenylphenol hydroxylase
VTLEDGREIQARLLVAADGANSRVRGLAGIPVRGWGYDQNAVVATVRPERPNRDTAWQRFMPSGPLAFLPINDGRCSIVWSTSPEQAQQLLALEPEAFCEALGGASDYVLGEILETGPRASFPLRLQHATHYVQPGLALVGDAAHAIHPLAGQGVNLGFLDAATLAEVLTEARRASRDIGSHGVLRRYERTRKGDNLMMLAAMDGFKRLFGNDLAPLRLLRNLGLRLTDSADPVKQLIMRRALGMLGEQPRLARPLGRL